MRGAAHLWSRQGTYYYRRRVPNHIAKFLSTNVSNSKLPPEVVEYFSKKSGFVQRSLRTKDKREAVKLCTEEDFKFSNNQAKVEQFSLSPTQGGAY